MRKTLSITSAFILLTLILTHGAIAQWKKNTVTNELPVTIYVTFATWQPASDDVTAEGYRTVGYDPIPPGGSQTFHAFRDNPVFFRFLRLDRDAPGDLTRVYLSPAADTITLSSWVPSEGEPALDEDGSHIGFDVPITIYESLTYKSFNIVTPRNAVFGPRQIKFTDVPERILEIEDGFINYPNGSHITVTGEWIFRWGFDFFGLDDPGAPVLDDRGNPVRADYVSVGIDDDFSDPSDDDALFGARDDVGDADATVTSTVVYWTNWDGGKIQRADLNNLVAENLVVGLERVVGITLDVPRHKMYWTSWETIGRSDMDGSNIEILVRGGVGIKEAIALDAAGGKIYWTVYDRENKIQRSNLDGSNVQTLVTGLSSPRGIALDVSNGKMYWADLGAGRIQRSNLNGSNVQTLISGLPGPNGVTLDVSRGKIYWADESTGSIHSANLDGSNIRDLVVGLDFVIGIAVDSIGQKVYWADRGTSKIQSANFDGSGLKDVFTGVDVLNLTVNQGPQQAVDTPLFGARDDGMDDGPSDLPVNIPDFNVRFSITSALGKDANAPISQAEMRSLESLVIDNGRFFIISDLTGLEFARNLRELDLSEIGISDISLLKDLVKLEKLNLDNNTISDVSPLKGLVNLTSLNLDNNTISDVSPLKGLVKLEKVELWRNPVRNADTLSHLTAEIQFEGLSADLPVNIPDFLLRSAIAIALGKNENALIFEAEMQVLESLQLGSGALPQFGWNEVSDLTGLEFARNLRELDLFDNNISDISPLKNLVKLERLNLKSNAISDISPLKGLVNLTRLDLAKNAISDVSPLKGLVNLIWLDLSNYDTEALDFQRSSGFDDRNANVKNAISDVSPLKGLINLTWLDLRRNPVRNAYELSHLTAAIHGANLQRCGTLMPDTLKPLHPVTVHRNYAKRKVSNGFTQNVNAPSGTVSSVVYANNTSRENRTWTTTDTVAKEETGSVILTVKFLSADEAQKLLHSKETEEKEIEKFDGKFLDPPWIMIHANEQEPILSILDPGEEPLPIIAYAAGEWSVNGNIRWKFLQPNEQGESDIRIAFVDPKLNINKSLIGYQNPDSGITMWLSTEAPYGVILHEFGHALGLTHEHLNPDFLKLFEWDDTKPDGWDDRYDLKWDDIPPNEKIYRKLASMYEGYDPEATGDDWADLESWADTNFLKPVKIDELYSEIDPFSVMTYQLPPSLLKAKTDSAKPYVDEEWAKEKGYDPPLGIGYQKIKTEDGSIITGFYRLSEKDKQFIENLYGPPLEAIRIEGSVHIKGEEHDCGGFLCLGETKVSRINKRETIPSTVLGHAEEYVKATEPLVFKWGGEQRVEVLLHNRRISKQDIEIAVTALLFHGAGVDNDDLDDVQCSDFRIRAGASEEVTLNLNVDLDWNGNLDWCDGLDIDRETSNWEGGDFAPGVNGYNKATVTVTLRTSKVQAGTPIDSPAAPSIASIVKTADPKHDVNGDGEINAADLVLVSQYFGRIPPGTPRVDVNNDNTVTITDLVHVAQHLQLSRVPAAPSVSMPSGLTYRTVEGWIDTARVESDGSRVFQIGIANLEALLLLIVPEETALLHNYPNPFNPETWIPYHLSEPAHAALTIYAIDGKVVRHLDLGHQVAGFYQSKSRAAHWDGRNNVGERVASGVYFYTLKAGEFAATRKLLILK